MMWDNVKHNLHVRCVTYFPTSSRMADSQFNIMEIVRANKTYEDYLDRNISEEDVFFLGSRETARQILEMSSLRGEVVKREEFEAAKREMQITRLRGQAFTTS